MFVALSSERKTSDDEECDGRDPNENWNFQSAI